MRRRRGISWVVACAAVAFALVVAIAAVGIQGTGDDTAAWRVAATTTTVPDAEPPADSHAAQDSRVASDAPDPADKTEQRDTESGAAAGSAVVEFADNPDASEVSDAPNADVPELEAPDASGPEVPQEEFVMPEEAVFEPGVALVEVDPYANPDEVVASLAALGGVSGVQASPQDVASGFVRVELAEGYAVEDAVNELRQSGVATQAQPNYLYSSADLLEDEEAELVTLQKEEADEQAAEPEDEVPEGEEPHADKTCDDEVLSAEEDAAFADEVLSAEEEPACVDAEPVDAELAPAATAEAEPVSTERVDEGPTDEEPASDEEAAASEPAAPAAEPNPLDEEPATDEDASGDLSPEAVSVSDPRAKSQWGLSSIRAYDAWGVAKTSHKVCVAVMDMGFDVSHEDLKANVVRPYNSMLNKEGASYLTGSASDVRHGTHVSGIIAAVSNNGTGVSGVSYNARIIPIKIADTDGVASSESFNRAFAYVRRLAKQYNIRVINMSVGSAALSIETMLKGNIDAAYADGIVTVASAGNLSSPDAAPYAHFPSDLENVVGVMNLERSGSGVRKADLSNYNRSDKDGKNIAAPGTSILSTSTNNAYVSLSGVSMAAPHVSGVMALEFAVNPDLSAEEAVSILYQTATDLGSEGWDRLYGWGEVNAYAAVRAVRTAMTEAKTNVVRSSTTSASVPALLSAAKGAIAEWKRNQAAADALAYRTHVQTYGWQAWKAGGQTSGTVGESKRLEGICIKLNGAPYAGSIQYRTHVQTYGWQDWKADGATSGTVGQGKRLEAIAVRLTGQMAKHYDVWYRVHAQTFGWMGWAKDGELAGTAGLSKRLEGIQICVLPKGSAAPGSTEGAYRTK